MAQALYRLYRHGGLMNYIIKIAHGTEYFINANTLLDLYNQLNVKHETLGIIPPQFETPLPPLQLAVFDPIIKDFPNPNLCLAL